MKTTMNVSKWWNHAIVNLVEYVTFDESDIEDMENTENIMFVIVCHQERQ